MKLTKHRKIFENSYESTKMYQNYKYDTAHPKYCVIYWLINAKQYYQYHKTDFNNGYTYP